MKTSNYLLMALLALGLSGAACNKSPAVKVEHTSMPAGPVELQLKWPLNRHAVQSFDMKLTLNMTVPGLPQPMKEDMAMGQDMALTVTRELDGGKREVEMEYLKMKVSASMAGKQMMEFDSSKKAAKDADPATAAIRKLVGAKIQFILDASNRVESVQGVEALQGRLREILKGDQSGTLKSLMGPDALKQMVDHAASLPAKPVKPGDSWPVQREYPLGQLGTLVLDFTNTLTGWEKLHDRWCAKIGVEGTIKSKATDPADAEVNGMSIKVSDGTCSGETWFDIDLGMFVESTLNNDLKMAITVPASRPGAKKTDAPQTQTISGDMHQTVEFKFSLQ